MSRTLAACLLAFAAAAALFAAPPPDPAQTTRKKSTAKSYAAPHKTTASTTGSQVHKPTTRIINSRKRTAAYKPAPVTWRSRQAVPSPERYKEIQEALASKGYLPQDQANGAWTDSSADALRRFQTDQNITATGKINSLSLIALGLGPRHDSAEAPKPEAPKPDPQGDGRQ